MAWAEGPGDIAVILAAGIGIANQQRNRRSGGFAFKHTRQNFNLIGLLPLSDMTRGARAPTVQIRLNIRLAQQHPRRTAVHHTADRRAVRFAKRGHHKTVANAVTGHEMAPG